MIKARHLRFAKYIVATAIAALVALSSFVAHADRTDRPPLSGPSVMLV